MSFLRVFKGLLVACLFSVFFSLSSMGDFIALMALGVLLGRVLLGRVAKLVSLVSTLEP